MDSKVSNLPLHEKRVRTANSALLALSVGAFAIGTTEFGPMGFLPDIASGVQVSLPQAGQIISAYAIGVMISAPLMTLFLARLQMRSALMVAMSLFTLGNLVSALAPSYETLLLARVLTSLNHGAFFGLGAIVAASLVPANRQARAIATMFMGLTIANIGGVPVAAWIGHTIGWRLAFAGIAVLGALAIVALRHTLPPGTPAKPPNLRRELSALFAPAVFVAIATSALGSAAMFTLYTYIAPALATLTGASSTFVLSMLVVIGVGFTLGNYLGGRLADWSLFAATRIILLVLALVMAAMPLLLMTHLGAIVGLLAFGVASFAIVPPMQVRVMQVTAGAPGLASSVNVGAFNFGNALGAGLGGIVISHGLGYGAIPIAGTLMAMASLALTFVGNASSNSQIHPDAENAVN